ncbi:hypothetical protein SELMODRAFT_423530 [Selaginella moellendorffii]|uniref:PARP catalytic domain-containing protein n=1 Tax=Selaginella moellendorffii TaxID=88036 RepID=D8SM02_SELML|nr:hypothetical protein SELMODRAFT_423530 [Selaginella moellendorffii]
MPEISTLRGLPFLISAAFVVKMVQGTLFGDDKVIEVKMNPFLGQEDYLVYKRFEQAFLGAASAQPKLAKITAADLEKSTGFQYHKLSDWILLLYHGTPSTNISSILESGFATVAARSKNRYWFSGDPFVCTSYADEDSSEYYLLAVLVLYPEKSSRATFYRSLL